MKSVIYISIISFFLFSFLGITSAQEQISPPVFDYVVRNNGGVKIFEGNRFYGLNDDAIRVSGKAQPGDTVSVFFNEKEYVAQVDEYGDWFVLFSITNPQEDEYIIEGQVSSDNGRSERVELATLVIGEEPEGDVEEIIKERKPLDIKSVFLILQSIVIVILLWILISPKILKSK